MDIRNFFGGNKLTANKSIESKALDNNKRKVIDDESESSENRVPKELKNVTIVRETVEHHQGTTDKSTLPPATAVIPKQLLNIITWNSGDRIPYMALVQTFERIEAISSRLEKESLFSNLFRSIILTTPEDLDSVIYLASNTVFPAYDGLELGIGDALLIKAVSESTGRKKDAVKAEYDKEGDLGIVASQSRSNQSTLSFATKSKPLIAVEVLEQLRLITRTTGDKAMDRKVDVIKKMLVRCQKNEAKYLIRALQGKLRIGTAKQTVLVSLAHAFTLSPPVIVQQAMLTKGASYVPNITEDIDEGEEEETAAEGMEVEEEVDTEGTEKENGNTSVSSTSAIEGENSLEPEEALKLRSCRSLGRSARLELAVAVVKRAFSECPSLSSLVTALLQHPLYDIHKVCRLCPGIPVAPMLAKPTKKLEEVLTRLSGQMFTMEYKYDGERAQIHRTEDGKLKIFSRNSEDNSNKYPDLIEVMDRATKEGITSFVIDAEVVAYDREKGCLLPFQILSTRKRKVEEGEENNQKVKVVLQAFDLLLLNGRSLLMESLYIRRELLLTSFSELEGFFYFAKGMDCQEDGDTAPIEQFMQEACAAQCEGLMVKTLNHRATYEPSRRSTNWLKLKKDYIDGMGVCDSVDLVPLGGYRGRGKRSMGYGAFLMACYDPENDEYQSVCKVGTGFKDEDLTRFFEYFQTRIIPDHRKPNNYMVDPVLEPDDWFSAEGELGTVWELAAADLSRSNVHRGGVGRLDGPPGRGIGLRFPRYLRERPDKKPENATTAEQIVDMFLSQDNVTDTKDADEDGDEDLL